MGVFGNAFGEARQQLQGQVVAHAGNEVGLRARNVPPATTATIWRAVPAGRQARCTVACKR